MNVYIKDESLLELLRDGYTTNKKYRKLPKDVIRGYVKAVQHIKAVNRIEDLYRINSLNYEQLKGNLKGIESVRCNKRWRLLFKSSTTENSIIITEIYLIEISDHYDD
ncbi:MAG: type II toxin-antitoxin system RelE/ParE family toxin [Muribaculaceae bacterium]